MEIFSYLTNNFDFEIFTAISIAARYNKYLGLCCKDKSL
jgi:hypothetical protein